jgi:transglutaminase-like putative cysteine protease
MLLSIRHVTRYTYAEPVAYSIQSLRLTPSSFTGQHVVHWRVRAEGFGPPLQFTDGFGNCVLVLTRSGAHEEVVIEAAGAVETADCNGIVAGLPEATPCRVYLRQTPQTRPDDAIVRLASSVTGNDTLARLHALAGVVRDRVAYEPGMTDVHTGAAEALADGKGVCQDHAHIFIAAARVLGVPARYVTGYLMLEDPGRADAHHAWAEAWADGLGWVGFDVTNRLCPTDRYVRLACGLDAGYAAPVTGSRRGGVSERLNVAVDVAVQSAQQ